MKMKYLAIAAGVSTLLNHTAISAHGLWRPAPGAALTTEITTAYRNRGTADEQLWQIPGILMGGETHGTQKGFELDSAVLELSYFDNEQVYGIAEVSTHGQHAEVEMEKTYIGALWQADAIQLQLEAGKLSAQFSPQHGSHANARNFVAQPLAYDALYGGHFNDIGARAILSHAEGKGLGIEIFNGDSYPSANNRNPGAADAFAFYHMTFDTLMLQNRVWFGVYKGRDRSDERLDSDNGHSHDLSNTSPTYWFDGDTRITGLRSKLIWLGWDWAQLNLTAEYMRADIEGTLRDNTRQAVLDSQVNAIWAALELKRGRHTLALSYDQLQTDNTLLGDAGPALAELSGLTDMGTNPKRFRLAYLQQWRDHLKWSVELHADNSNESDFNTVLFALRWNGTWP